MADNHMQRISSLKRALELADHNNPQRSVPGRRMRTNEEQSDAESYQKVIQRATTSTYTDTISINKLAPGAYASDLFRWTMDRLDQAQLRTNRMTQDHFQYLLPNSDTTPDQMAIFDALHYRPMTVSNHDLSRIMKLEISNQQSPATDEGQHFYIRSWTLTPEEFRLIIDEMTQSDHAYEELLEWRKVVDLYAPLVRNPEEAREDVPPALDETEKYPATLLPPDNRKTLKRSLSTKLFTVRYVGTVVSPSRPYDRYVRDLRKRTSGILHEFCQTLQRILPKVADAAEVHLIVDASLLSPPEVNKFNKDDVERVLIEYFDHHTLLNRKRGGYFTGYVPESGDVDAFNSMEINFYNKLKASPAYKSDEMLANIKDHSRRIQQFANDNPAETGTSRDIYENDLRDCVIREGTPYIYQNVAVLMVLIGKDITLSDYLGCRAFFEGGSQACTFTADNLIRLIKQEAQRLKKPQPPDFDRGHFPFTNLWHWLQHKPLDVASEFLGEYLQITQPIIAVVFSRPVNSLTRANFQHQHGVLSKSFVDEVGQLVIRFTDVDDNGTGIPETAFINIAHVDPGRDKYTARNLELRRLVDLTWQKTMLVGQIAMEVIDENLPDTLPRLQLCQEIIHRVEELEGKDPRFEQFVKNFTASKKDFKDREAEYFSNLPSEDVRPVLNQAGRLKMASLGQAEGEPNTPERRRQLELLWIKHIPDLHLHIPHDEANRERWINEFMPLGINQFYFLYVISQFPEEEYLKRLLRHFRPRWAQDDEWMKRTADRDEAINQCGLWFLRPKLTAEGKQQIVHSHFPDPYATAHDMEGRPVGVNAKTGIITLRWLRPDGSLKNIRLTVKTAIPSNEGSAVRYVHFTEEGIDICNVNNEPLRFSARADKPATASVHRTQLPNTYDGALALQLWQAVRTSYGHSLPADESSDDAREWKNHLGNPAVQDDGVAALNNTAQTEVPRQNRPPHPLDANYLLHEFLNERFPNGGTFRTAEVTRVADSTDDLNGFIAFLSRPDYIGHPYSIMWRNGLANPNGIQLLSKNLPILRSVQVNRDLVSGAPKQAGTNKSVRVRETRYFLGPPGSAAGAPALAAANVASSSRPVATPGSGAATSQSLAATTATAAAATGSSKAQGKRKQVDEAEEDEAPPRSRTRLQGPQDDSDDDEQPVVRSGRRNPYLSRRISSRPYASDEEEE